MVFKCSVYSDAGLYPFSSSLGACSDPAEGQLTQLLDYFPRATVVWTERFPSMLLLLCHFLNSLLPFVLQSFGATLGSLSVIVVPSSAYPCPGSVTAGQRVRIRVMKPTVQVSMWIHLSLP